MKTEVALQMKQLVLDHAESLNMNFYARQLILARRVPLEPLDGLLRKVFGNHEWGVPPLEDCRAECRTVCCMAGHLALALTADRPFDDEGERARYLEVHAYDIAKEALDLSVYQAQLLFLFINGGIREDYLDSANPEIRGAARCFDEVYKRLREYRPFTIEYAQVVASAIDLAIELWGGRTAEPEVMLEPATV